MVYIPPINTKLGPTNMAPMDSKTWVLKHSSIQSFFEISGCTKHVWHAHARCVIADSAVLKLLWYSG